MPLKERFWTYALVTVVTLLIWYWAAAETRDTKSRSFRLALRPAVPAEQIISPSEVSNILVTMEGSRLALERAGRLGSGPLVLTVGEEIPAQLGRYRVDLAEALAASEMLADTGVRVLTADPAEIEIQVDALVPVTGNVVARLPGVDPDGPVEIDPSQATVKLPQSLRERIGDDLVIEAVVPPSRIERLEPGVQSTVENVKLRLPPQYAGEKGVSFSPPVVDVTFTIRSTIREITLPTVRVQVAGPPEDHEEYIVEIEDNTLTDVTVKAPDELIRQIGRGDAVVVALVHLSHGEKEHGIKSKPVTAFMALPKETVSNIAPTIVEAEVGGTTTPPVIRLSVRERSAG